MAIEYLQIVSVPVSSQDHAKEFYVNGLGWERDTRVSRIRTVTPG